jgi:hypothetical protein
MIFVNPFLIAVFAAKLNAISAFLTRTDPKNPAPPDKRIR